jgi:asparagine synthase (glutamine-hydrolysing)
VVLSGAGADELHGAYGRAESLSRFSRWAKFSGGASGFFGSAAVAALRITKGATAAERLALMLAESGEPWRLAQERRRFFTRSQIALLWPDSVRLAGESPFPPTADPDAFAKLGAFEQVTLAELRGYLRDMLLRDGDWATMANSQELRVPFMGRRYVECVLRLPAKMRTKRRGVNKPLLAAAISAPNRQLLRRRKTGFNISRAELLTGPFKEEFHAAKDTLRERLGISLDATAALQRLKETQSPSEAFRLWALLSLGAYLEQHAGPRSNSSDDI